jgi:FkbM family methyltransferase
LELSDLRDILVDFAFLRKVWLRYLRVTPIGFRSAVRLWFGYCVAAFLLLIIYKGRTGVGNFIPGRGLIEVKVDGLLWLVRPHSGDLGLVLGTQEPEVLRWFAPRAGEIVIDVGSHIGCYALRASKRGCNVIAIEPDPISYGILLKNLILNGFTSTKAFQEALSNERGVRRLFLAEASNTGRSSLKRKISGKSVNVAVEELDELVHKMELSRVDWLKIDVEGSELDVLHGGSSTLHITRRVIIEVDAKSKKTVIDLLKANGFVPVASDIQPEVTYLLFAR